MNDTCDCEIGEDSHKNSKEHQLERILSENLRMIPDKSDESDKYAFVLSVEPEDDDILHSKEHRAFMKANTLRPQFKAKLEEHSKKHDIAYKEKVRMGLLKEEKKEEKDTGSETYPAQTMLS